MTAIDQHSEEGGEETYSMCAPPLKDDDQNWVDVEKKFGTSWIGFQWSKWKVRSNRYAARCNYCKAVIPDAWSFKLYEHVKEFKGQKCTIHLDKQKEYLQYVPCTLDSNLLPKLHKLHRTNEPSSHFLLFKSVAPSDTFNYITKVRIIQKDSPAIFQPKSEAVIHSLHLDLLRAIITS
jgi:hypothetical protein